MCKVRGYWYTDAPGFKWFLSKSLGDFKSLEEGRRGLLIAEPPEKDILPLAVQDEESEVISYVGDPSIKIPPEHLERVQQGRMR